MFGVFEEENYTYTYDNTRSNRIVAAGCLLKTLASKFPHYNVSSTIINISRDSVEVNGEAITSLYEVDTFVGAEEGGRLHLLIVNRDFPLVIYKYRTQ